MTQEITTTDADHAVECIKWLRDTLGPGAIRKANEVIGKDWKLSTYYATPNLITTYCIELSSNVNEETQIMFQLKWS
ncbi:hypothetical protein UFOVP190_11 [uncultured Caudovirales phage]|uniref:Uncharacterized protein n=1 Tax=uncultured Caudovirales phage TaxID=2100421 RepID=A0A6J7WNC3_9CAUD|nr:hypothetical protein UFOVP190_11 [uncultured Caudovirales phage]